MQQDITKSSWILQILPFHSTLSSVTTQAHSSVGPDSSILDTALNGRYCQSMEATHLDSTIGKSENNVEREENSVSSYKFVKRLMPEILTHYLWHWISKLGGWIQSYLPSAHVPVPSPHPTAEPHWISAILQPLASQDSKMPIIGRPPNGADDTALIALVRAFSRWQKGEPKSADGISDSIIASYLSIADDQPPIPKPPCFAFLQSLATIDPTDLPADERDCDVCFQAYRPWSDQEHQFEDCVATRLPCNHVVGSRCIFQWLWPLIEVQQNSCPYCRKTLFPKMASIRKVEGLQERVDLSDWRAERFCRAPSAREQRLLAIWTRRVVEFRITQALWELDKNYKKGLLVAKAATEETMEVAKADWTSLLVELKERKKTIDRIEHLVKISDQKEKRLQGT